MWYSIVKEKQRDQAKANSRAGWNGKRSDDAVTISGGTAEAEQGEMVFLISQADRWTQHIPDTRYTTVQQAGRLIGYLMRYERSESNGRIRDPGEYP